MEREASVTVDQAELITEQLLEHATRTGMSSDDLLVVTAMSLRLLQKVLYPRDVGAVIDLMQEADATFTAVSTLLERN